MKFSRIKKLFFLNLSHLPMKSRGVRSKIVKMGGVNILNPKTTFVGENVIFDTIFPENITIEEHVIIATGCVILTHFLRPRTWKYTRGKVLIKEGAYIGCNTIICKPVTIGKWAVVGAGSVVTKDIPAGEVWAGNPARFIKKRSELECV